MDFLLGDVRKNMHLRSEFGGLQEWHSIFGGENDVHQNKGERLRHIKLHHLYMLLSRSILRPLGRVAVGGCFPGLKPGLNPAALSGHKTIPSRP